MHLRYVFVPSSNLFEDVFADVFADVDLPLRWPMFAMSSAEVKDSRSGHP